MSTILTPQGFDPQRLTPELARVLGDGGGLLAEAARTNCALIEPAHFLGYLVRTGGTIFRVEFLEAKQADVDQFCELLYSTLDDQTAAGIPATFGWDVLSDASQGMLESLDQEMANRKLGCANEALLLWVLLQHAGHALERLLAATAGSEDAWSRFTDSLDRRIVGHAAPDPFDPQTDALVEAAFDKSGRRVLNLLREETAALGSAKTTAMHLLYALLGIENGVLQRAVQFQAIDPVKEVHAHLARQLTRPGAKRVRDFELGRGTLHESVIRILQGAASDAHRQALPIAELHIARSLVAARSNVVLDFLTSRKVHLDILREFLARAEVDAEEAAENLRIPVAQIETELKKGILGQDHALKKIMPWIKRLRFGFPRDRGPAAVLLFLGPSGTGKTQLAKELARTVYGSEDALVMLEMGQFNSKESINIFIGAPPGYIGYGEGKLTNGLRDKPQSVVLFDEVEKAHEEVWVALLRFLDEGLISDPAGPTRDGRKCIIVLTSNLGADKLADRLPADADDIRQTDPALEDAIRAVVLPYLKRPEIYNRVDDKVVFRPFDRDTYQRLVQRQVEMEVRKFGERGKNVQVTEEVIQLLTDRALESKLEGARCVPRLVNSHVVSPVIDVLTADEERDVRKVIVSKRGQESEAEEA